MLRERLLVITALLLALLSPARAEVVTWQLQNVGFDDGGQATGWFNVNNITHTFIDWNISVHGGNTSIFPDAVYSPLTSTLNSGFSDPYSYALPLWNNFYLNFEMIDISSVYARDRQLRLAFVDLPDVGGVVSIDPTNAFASECYNCGPDRLFVIGGTIAAVPELSTWAMLLIGFAAIGFANYHSYRVGQRRAT
jgi:hypothetical protein